MNEKDKALQEENKAIQDGMMSDDELDSVSGGLFTPGKTDQFDCACMDGLGSSSGRPYICRCLDGQGHSDRL